MNDTGFFYGSSFQKFIPSILHSGCWDLIISGKINASSVAAFTEPGFVGSSSHPSRLSAFLIRVVVSSSSCHSVPISFLHGEDLSRERCIGLS